MDTDFDDVLIHHGVKGMKWGYDPSEYDDYGTVIRLITGE